MAKRARSVEKNIKDTKEGKELINCINQLGLLEKLSDIENWKVIMQRQKFVKYKICIPKSRHKDCIDGSDNHSTNGENYKEISDLRQALI